jgi:PAS domain S-box-containing protein
VDLPGLHKTGRKIPLELSFGEFVKNGRRYFTGIARDITERKKVEDALRRSEEHFRAIFEGAGVGNVECEATTGRFLLVNQEMGEITGYSADELLTMKFSDITHPEDREKNFALYQRFIKKEAPHYAVEKRYIRKDGTIVWVHVSSTLLCDTEGQASNTVAVIQDITQRKHAEQELSKSEERYRDLVENARDIIYSHDLEGNYTSINKAGEQITGYSREEALKMNLSQTVDCEKANQR